MGEGVAHITRRGWHILIWKMGEGRAHMGSWGALMGEGGSNV